MEAAMKPTSPGAKTMIWETMGTTWTALRDLIGQLGGQLPGHLALDEEFDPQAIKVRLEVRCKKKKLEQAGPLMNVLANSLRHVESDLVEVQFADGSRLRGTDLKVSKKVPIECVNHWPVPQQVDKAMAVYLHELIESGKIK